MLLHTPCSQPCGNHRLQDPPPVKRNLQEEGRGGVAGQAEANRNDFVETGCWGQAAQERKFCAPKAWAPKASIGANVNVPDVVKTVTTELAVLKSILVRIDGTLADHLPRQDKVLKQLAAGMKESTVCSNGTYTNGDYATGGGHTSWKQPCAAGVALSGAPLSEARFEASRPSEDMVKNQFLTEASLQPGVSAKVPEETPSGPGQEVSARPASAEWNSGRGATFSPDVRLGGPFVSRTMNLGGPFFRSATDRTERTTASLSEDGFAQPAADIKSLAKRIVKEAKSGPGRGQLMEEAIGNACAKHLVLTRHFDMVCAVIILLNAAWTGGTLELSRRGEHEAAMAAIDIMFTVYFTSELALRMAAFRRNFFDGLDKFSHMFDTILVVFSLMEVVLQLTSSALLDGNMASAMQTMRMLRIIRVFRMFRFLRELSLLAVMILDSVRSLCWAWVLVSLVMYVFAVVLTQGVVYYLDSRESSDELLHSYFGTVDRSLYTLLQTMLGGVSWGEASNALMATGWVYPVLFFVYIVFVMLAVLNIITAVFVDNAMQIANTQRDVVVEKELEIKQAYIAEISQLFSEMDEDHSGSITWEEFEEYMDDERIRSYFNALELDTSDNKRLFQMLDTDNTGKVSTSDFLEGCLRLKGFARSIDANAILHEVKLHRSLLDVIVRTLQPGWDGTTRAFSEGHEGMFSTTPSRWSQKQIEESIRT